MWICRTPAVLRRSRSANTVTFALHCGKQDMPLFSVSFAAIHLISVTIVIRASNYGVAGG